MKIFNYKCLVIPFGAGLAGAAIIYVIGAQKSYIVVASLVSGSAGALIINNRKKDENATSRKIADASEVSDQNSEKATLHFVSGIKYKDREEYLIACQEFDKAIAINPNEEKFYLHRAMSKEVLGEYQEALINYAKAIELNPDYANAFNGLGSVKSSLGDNEAAVKHYTKAISIDPNYAVAYYNRGYSKAELGNHSSAINDFTKSLEIDPDDPDAYMNRGISKAELGDNEAAYEDFKKARELSDDSTT